MKNIAFISLALFFSILQIACEGNDPDKIKIGFSMESFNSARWIQDKTHFENKVKELGGELIIKESIGDESVQFQQAIDLINSGIDVLVIIPSNVNTAASIVREAHKKNVKVIAYDRMIKNSELDYFIGFDSHQIGIIQAEYAIKKMPRGNYILIEGDKTDITAVQTKEGQLEILQPKVNSGDINLLYQIYVDEWSPETATHEFKRVYNLSNEKIDVILSANDGMVSGIVDIIDEYGIDMPIITGMDADLEACKRIMNNKQSMTVYTPIKKLASTAAELAIKIAKTNKPDYQFQYLHNGRIEVPSIILDAIVVEKENMEETIIKDGVYSKEEVFGI